ncbi:MAG: hypothetical protein Q8M29_04960 [Bacteroidota bacterium]|nr:hypothetical protein [Bacteroidota bacterium]
MGKIDNAITQKKWKMKIKHLMIIPVFFVFISFTSKELSFIVSFEKNSARLNNKSFGKISELKKTTPLIKKDKSAFLLLVNHTSYNELKKYPLLGLQRAKAIIDYLEKTDSIPRSKFHIIDRINKENVSYVPNNSGIEIIMGNSNVLLDSLPKSYEDIDSIGN